MDGARHGRDDRLAMLGQGQAVVMAAEDARQGRKALHQRQQAMAVFAGDGVHLGVAQRQRRVVHKHRRRLVAAVEQLGFQPFNGLIRQPAAGGAGAAGVDKQQAGGEVVHRVMHVLRVAAELRAQRVQVFEKQFFIVVVAGDQIQRIVQAAEDLAGNFVLLRAAAVDDIAADHHRVRALRQGVELGDHVGVGGVDVDKAVQLLSVAAEMGIGNLG